MGNLISDLASGATAGLFDSIGTLATKIREAIKGKEIDPTVKAQIEEHVNELEQALVQGQLAINLEEAKSDKWWKAGWRPFIGWICGVGLLVQYVLLPILSTMDIVPKQPLDFSQLITLLVALLGMGTLRTMDKKLGNT